jgi:tight adherence protein E
MNKSRSKISTSKGIATIEFAIGFIFFWYMCAAWVELSFMSYVSALGDLAIASATEQAKKYEGDSKNFLTEFKNKLSDNNSLWSGLYSVDDFKISVVYLKDLDELSSYSFKCFPKEGETSAECGTATGSAIALYRINYDYTPIFNYSVDSNLIFSREMIVIQENQRDKF